MCICPNVLKWHHCEPWLNSKVIQCPARVLAEISGSSLPCLPVPASAAGFPSVIAPREGRLLNCLPNSQAGLTCVQLMESFKPSFTVFLWTRAFFSWDWPSPHPSLQPNVYLPFKMHLRHHLLQTEVSGVPTLSSSQLSFLNVCLQILNVPHRFHKCLGLLSFPV